MAAVMRFDRLPPLTRHPGLVPGSTGPPENGVPSAFLLAAEWTPEQVRGDGVVLEDGGLKQTSICDSPF